MCVSWCGWWSGNGSVPVTVVQLIRGDFIAIVLRAVRASCSGWKHPICTKVCTGLRGRADGLRVPRRHREGGRKRTDYSGRTEGHWLETSVHAGDGWWRRSSHVRSVSIVQSIFRLILHWHVAIEWGHSSIHEWTVRVLWWLHFHVHFFWLALVLHSSILKPCFYLHVW